MRRLLSHGEILRVRLRAVQGQCGQAGHSGCLRHLIRQDPKAGNKRAAGCGQKDGLHGTAFVDGSRLCGCQCGRRRHQNPPGL